MFMKNLLRYVFCALLCVCSIASMDVYGVYYYVNDSATNGDVYCSVAGDDMNDGMSVSTPMLTITNLIARVDLESGDAVYIDTGIYSNYTVTLGLGDSGAKGNPVVIQGSTNIAAGGTVIQRNNTTGHIPAIYLGGVHDIEIFHMTAMGAAYGYYISGNDLNVTLSEIQATVCNYGMRVDGAPKLIVERSSIYDNRSYGINFVGGRGTVFDRVVFMGNTHHLYDANNMAISVNISNCVFSGGIFYSGALSGLYGDNNLFWGTSLTDGNVRGSLSEIQSGRNIFWHSTVANPQFADEGDGDFHPKSVMGRYDEASGNWVTDAVHSVLIDFGDRGAAVGDESEPNGGVVNVGAYGGTWQASRSRTNAWLLALTYNDGGRATGATNGLYWKWGQFADGALVNVQFLTNQGGEWASIASNVPVTNGMVNWDVSGVGDGAAYWRVVSVTDTAVMDQNDQQLAVNGGYVPYYVNDVNIVGDVYCSASGDDANDGLSPESPMLSLSSLLAKYDFSGSDIIYVDTGIYSNYTVALSGADGGSSVGGHMCIVGSTNWSAGGSVFERNSSGTAGFDFYGADYYHLKWLTIRRTGPCVQLRSGSDHNIFEGVTLQPYHTGVNGVQMDYNGGYYNKVIGSAVRGGKYSLSLAGGRSGGHTVDGCVFDSPGTAAIYGANYATISNSIFLGGKVFGSSIAAAGDYNTFCNTTFGYDSLREFQEQQGGWWHCTVAEPGFVDSDNGDFHVVSQAGRYDPVSGGWVTDGETSILVDFGGPEDDFSMEPEPNGARVNAGAYGNTAWASKSPAGVRLQVLSFNDGGSLDVPGGKVYWHAAGVSDEDLVRIELSLNGGGNWVTAAVHVAASEGEYAWEYTNGLYSSDSAQWRVVHEGDPSVVSVNAEPFYFHYGAANYYLNDGSRVGDVYTRAIGSDANSGRTADDPKYSLASLLADGSIHIRAGDEIYADTGHYVLRSNNVMASLVVTSAAERISIIGSTNSLGGGTVWDRNSTNGSAYGLRVSDVDYLAIRDVAFVNGEAGLLVNGCDGVQLERVVCAGNSGDGMLISASSVDCSHSVFDGNGGAGVNVSSGVLSLTNSSVTAVDSLASCIRMATTNCLVSDYNNLYAEGDALVGVVADRGVDSLSAWAECTGQDMCSLSEDPLFADAAGYDFHVQSAEYAGRFDPSVGWVQDAESSRLIDAGDPGSVFSAEPAYNGGRVNIGRFGGTAEASKGTDSPWLYCASPNGGRVKGVAALHWVAGGSVPVGLVRVEYSGDGGQSWSTLTSGVDAVSEVVYWDTRLYDDTPAGLWRVIAADESVSDRATNFFGVGNSAWQLYVNDDSTEGDIYCTAVGDAANFTASREAPLDSLGRVTAWFDLEAGDQVFVDNGWYSSVAPVVFGRKDGGLESKPVEVIGAITNGAEALLQFDGNAGVELAYVVGVEFVGVVVSNAAPGYALDHAAHISIDSARVQNGDVAGIRVLDSDDVQVQHTVICDGAGYGVYSDQASNLVLRNVVVWSNELDAVYADASELQVMNSVLSADGAGQFIFHTGSGDVPQSDYNDLLLWNGAQVAQVNGRPVKSVLDWQNGQDNDWHSLTHDPLFADAADGDFHLKSVTGRLEGTNWVQDASFSPLIDMGRPGDSYGTEPDPNGKRINGGVYGGTAAASMSNTNGWLLALTCNDGGTIRGSNWLYWAAGGSVTGQVVSLQYSEDGGSHWINMAEELPATTGGYLWDTTTNGPYTSVDTYWRVINADTTIVAQTEQAFIVNNGPLQYYVNDASRVKDVFCTAVGSAENDGLSTNRPKTSLEEVLAAYTLRAGDTVYIDTGNYTQQSAHVFSGIAGTNQLLVTGSTNGSVLYASGVSYSFQIESSVGVQLNALCIRNASTALYINNSTNTEVNGVDVQDCTTGLRVNNSKNSNLQHCLAVGGQRGFWQQGSRSSGTKLGNCVFWSNSISAVNVEYGSISVSNSVLAALAAGDYAYVYRNTASLVADYNALVLQGGGCAALYDVTDDVIYQTVAAWSAMGDDRHSLSVDPLFADVAARDFHLKTQALAGRYNPATGSWAQDTETSPLIDAGSFISTNETSGSGSVVNIGLYGNSTQASRTPTNGWLTVLSYNDGGAAQGVVPLNWAVGGVTTGHTLRISVSTNNGVSWAELARGVPSAARSYSWDSTAWPSLPLTRWKLESEQASGITATNAEPFSIRNQSLQFYVNDGSTNGDMYCSGIGSKEQTGVHPGDPLNDIQCIFERYDLDAGDTVFADTGVYMPEAEIVIDRFDSGTAVSPVVLQGSTNDHFGGSALQFSGGTNGLYLSGVTGFTVKNITCSGASIPVRLNAVEDCRLEWVQAVSSGSYGFYLNRADRTILTHCSSRGG